MSENRNGEQYSIWVGLIYVFNLIVGTGALTLPAAFNKAGWILGSVVVLILGFISFITVTFVIETMASANAIIAWRRIQNRQRIDSTQSTTDQISEEPVQESGHSDAEDTPLVTSTHPDYQNEEPVVNQNFNIHEKVEMGEMASIFFSKMGILFFYICLAVYLYGDLSIYGTAVAKSMADVACTYIPKNFSCNDTIPDYEPCWENYSLSRISAYRLFLTIFVFTLGQFAFFNVQKTKYLQVLTSMMRWLAFSIMIIYAVRKLLIDGPQGHPNKANTSGIPGLFGVCVYSFMCHHSLPALIAPIANKSKLNKSLSLDFILIASFYLLLALTGIFAFDQLDDLYTLDFGPHGCSENENWFLIFIEYFLALFPVFTLSTSFPIIAITLRNNLQSLFLREGQTYGFVLQKLLFPILAVIPPYLIAFCTKNLTILVGITGSYAGTGIQYLIPVFLVYNARIKSFETFGHTIRNKYASPFSGISWLIFIFLWSVICMFLVSLNFIEKYFSTDKIEGYYFKTE